MIEEVTIPALRCRCDLCGYSWISLATEPPKWCGNLKCRSRQWNGKKLPSYVNEIKLPAPRKAGRPKTITLLDESEA